MKNYKPDWSKIPEQFAFVYVVSSQDVIATTLPFDQLVEDGYTEHARPGALVDGEFYAVTDDYGIQYIGRYCESDNDINCDGKYKDVSLLTIHGRISDEIWKKQLC